MPIKMGSNAGVAREGGGVWAERGETQLSSSLPSHLGSSFEKRMSGASPIARNMLLESGKLPLQVPRVNRDQLFDDEVSSKGFTVGSLTNDIVVSGSLGSARNIPEASSPLSSGNTSRDSSFHSSHHSQRVLSAGFPFGEGRISQGVTDLRDKVSPGGSSWDGSSRSVALKKDGRVPQRALELDCPSAEDHDGERQGCFHPQRPLYKALVLFLQCMLTFGSFYCYDIPGALKSNFFKRFPTLTQLEYNLMYSLYSWPNTVQVFFGGYIIDKYVGVRWGCTICALLGLIGQIMVSIGVQTRDLDLILLGRFVFGMGGETLCVAQSAYVAKWFKGAELATAFGICLSFSRLGSAVNFDISPAVVTMEGPYGGFVAAEYWGVAATVLSLLCVLLLNAMDHHADQVREAEKRREQRGRSISQLSVPDDPVEEEVSLSDVWTFGLDVWLIFLICISFYASVFVFLQNGVQFIRQRYDKTEQQAAFLMSLPYTISAVACPIFGYLVDQTGRALVWVFLSTLLLGTLHFCFAFYRDFPPWVGVSAMGISYSVCAAALWPCIAIVVELHKLGTAYGLMTAFQNLGLAVFPLLIANMLPEDSATNTTDEFLDIYAPVMSVFAGCGAAGATLTVVLFVVDARNKGWLNASAAALLQREAEEAQEEEDAMRTRAGLLHEYETEPLLPDMHIHVSHQRGRYLSRLGIRPSISIHGGPRPFSMPKQHILTPGWDYERGLAHFQKRTEPLNADNRV
uniref:Lysosomal dipeptide transporter MFSD1 n=2 Tax=Hemiselmis andersenii TaxID=464988 RepID=A0A7S1ECX8_HEMAN|mmetsp:Transcript_43216/g.105438  ORF Transcript_43216/g.105438 Transcript_43216/m.105438 type:complete len:742 (+) Transcript_43216:1-2226(+)